MKKFLAILLAMMLVLVNVAALATELDPDGGETGTEPTTTEGGTTTEEDANILDNNNMADAEGIGTETTVADQAIAITKAILRNPVDGVDTDDETKPVSPAQTLTFTAEIVSVAESTATTAEAPAIEIDDAVFEEGVLSADININIKAPFPAVGIYTYKVTEDIGDAAGMQEMAEMELKITIIQSGENLVIGGLALRESGSDTKIDTIENEYHAGSLTVGKTVTGNLGDKQKDFEIDITFTAPTDTKVYGTIAIDGDGTVKEGENAITEIAATEAGWTTKTVTITVKDSETVTFYNIPAGVTYAIEEHDYTGDEDGNGYDDPEYTNEEGTITKAIASEETVTNNKDIKIDTGIELETLPFVLLMGIALVGVMTLRRREDY